MDNLKTDLQQLEELLELLKDYEAIYYALSDESIVRINESISQDLYNIADNIASKTSTNNALRG